MFKSFAQSKFNEGKTSAMAGAKKASGKAKVKYAAVFILLLVLPSALGWLNFDTPPYFFIGVQVYSLLIGTLHLWQMGRRFGWRNIESFYQKLGLTLSILLIAMLLQAVVIYLCPPFSDFWKLFPTSLLFFMLPLLTISTFDFAIIIPPAIYKKWKYPDNIIMPDPDSIDFSNSYIVTFELKKSVRDAGNTFMKFKAPQDRLTFGELFLFCMSEYNERNRDNQIQYLNELHQPFEWLFHIKPQKWWQSKTYIDPSLTVRENKIRENFIIVSQRV